MVQPPVIEEEEGDGDQVESENGDQVETDVDLSPGKVIQDIAVVMPPLKHIFKTKMLLSPSIPRVRCDCRIVGDS